MGLVILVATYMNLIFLPSDLRTVDQTAQWTVAPSSSNLRFQVNESLAGCLCPVFNLKTILQPLLEMFCGYKT